MSIYRKLSLAFVSVALLVGAVGYLCLSASEKALQRVIGETSAELAHYTLGKVDRTIHYRIEQLQSYCKNLAYEEALLDSNREFDELDDIQSYMQEKDQAWISAGEEEITPFMQELISSSLSEELRGKLELEEFYKEKYGYKVYGEVFVTNRYGANVAQTGKTSDYYQADEKWWQAAKEDDLYIGDVEYDRSAEAYSINIAVRIDDEEGNFDGVMKGVLNIEEVLNIIREAEKLTKYQTTEFKLITEDGRFIYSTEGHDLLQHIPDDLFSRLEREEHADYFIAEGDMSGEEEELFAHAHSKGCRDFEGLGWILVVEHKTGEICAPVARLRFRLVVTSILLVILALSIGLLISRSISKPVARLSAATIEIGRGNLDTQIEIKSHDEMGRLADAFNAMVSNLKNVTAFRDSLDREVIIRKEAEDRLIKVHEQLKDQVFELRQAREAALNMMQDAEEARGKAAQANEMLRESKEQFRFLVETTSDWIWEVDQNGTYTYASPKVRDLLGYESEEIIGRTPFDFMSLEEAKRVAGKFAGYVEARIPFNGLENTNLHKDGRVVVLETSGVPIFDVDGHFGGYRGVDRDITERKRAESELKRHAEELAMEKETAEKNASELVMAFDQLNEAKRDVELAKQKAEEVNRELKQVQSQMVQHEKLASIGQLASGVAHEMNTPVGFVASNFQTLESYVEKIQVLIDKYEKLLTEIPILDETELQNEVDAIREYWNLAQLDFIIEDMHVLFKDSEEGLERISNIIENLRDFSRIDQVQEFADYNINEGLEATLVVARNEIKYHADVKTELSDMPPVYCSASQINQVFLNIIVNAAQAITSQEREDRGIISIKTYAMADELVCEISDDGSGIPPDKLSKVFDPFFTTKPAGKGTGLGLSISYDIIVNKHHGDLLVESTVGKGTKFTIKLPFNKDEKPAEEKDKKQWKAEQFYS